MENLSVLVLDRDPVSLWTISNTLARFNFKGAHFNSQASPFQIFPFLSKKEVVFRGRMKDSRYKILHIHGATIKGTIWCLLVSSIHTGTSDRISDISYFCCLVESLGVRCLAGSLGVRLFGGNFGCTAAWREVWVYGRPVGQFIRSIHQDLDH